VPEPTNFDSLNTTILDDSPSGATERLTGRKLGIVEHPVRKTKNVTKANNDAFFIFWLTL
jgi:hypothetical protein